MTDVEGFGPEAEVTTARLGAAGPGAAGSASEVAAAVDVTPSAYGRSMANGEGSASVAETATARLGAAGSGASGPASGGAAGGVRVVAVDVGGLCGAGLSARLGVIARAESQLAGLKADVLGEIARRSGDGAAEHAAKHTLSVSGRQARSEVNNAVALGDLDATRGGLADGRVPAGHARLIARASRDAPIDEAFLAERAAVEGYDQFRRTVARHVADVSCDDGISVLERQRQARSASIYTRAGDGMTVLRLETDPITGARLGTVIAAAERRLFGQEDPNGRRTPAQRAADAVTQLILDPDAKRASGTSLVVVADYDTVNHQLANSRLADGTPIPISEIAQIAVHAELLPAIFDAATGDLRMGRSRRTATELQRAALALRDRGCVGCGAPPERSQQHHIRYWQHGGPTDYPNLVTVCHNCHQKIHQQGFTVEWQPGQKGTPGQPAVPGQYRLQPPDKPPDQTSDRQPDPSRPPRQAADQPKRATSTPAMTAAGQTRR